VSLPADIARLVGAIHAAPQLLVYSFAGAGSQALYWLHAVAGSSRTLLEARDCYAAAALADLLGAPPAQAVSAETALAMAAWSAQRAAALAPGAPRLGVACTAAIATDRARRGADRTWVAVQRAEGGSPALYELALAKSADRLTQEAQVSRLVIEAIARACGLVG
jgi:nicotinamide mononucleotide (NMN) deamidase PncC